MFHRAGREWSDPFPKDTIPRATVWVFDAATGRVVRSWGAGQFIMPHGLTIDHEDNVWLTDVGRHQVFKFAPDGHLLLVLGEAGVPGSDARHFDMLTDVGVARDGTFYVSDGYGNTRVLKFAADGALQLTWGTRGPGPEHSTCRTGSRSITVGGCSSPIAAIRACRSSTHQVGSSHSGRQYHWDVHTPSSQRTTGFSWPTAGTSRRRLLTAVVSP